MLLLLLRVVWDPFGPLSASFWSIFGNHFEYTDEALGIMGIICCSLGTIWASFRLIWAPFWVPWGAFRHHFGAFWDHLGVIWARWGAMCGICPNNSDLGIHLGRQNAPKITFKKRSNKTTTQNSNICVSDLGATLGTTCRKTIKETS